jgi:catechol 2,3-dioxygenase-like lactoylglutathione lyase family enzyme
MDRGVERAAGMTGADRAQFDLGDRRVFELLRRDPGRIRYGRTRFQPGSPVEDIDRARDRLLALGAEQLTEMEDGPEHGGLWCYFRDPQGHVFELTQPIPASLPAPDPSGHPIDGLR